MKRILLRFENTIGSILTFTILSFAFGFVALMAFLDYIILVGCLFAVLCAGFIIALLYYSLRKEVIIDFKHNLIKMKAGTKKERCEVDKVKNLEIIFHWVKKMDCYSAQVFAYLKDGKIISIKIYPESHHYRWVYYFTGRVTKRLKLRIEKQVKGYDFITCRTENQ